MDRLDEWSFKSKTMELADDFFFDYGTEEVTDYQDPSELLAALKQKEEEVILAAQLGNALLLENRQLKEESEKLHVQYADKLEELEQGKHELRLKLEACQTQWESQVGDLERDIRELNAQVEQLTQALSEAGRAGGRAEREHLEYTQRLREQLGKAMEVERAMSNEVQVLKHDLQQRGGHSRPQDEEVISALREQVVRLSQKEQALEERLENVSQENAELRDSLAALHLRMALQEQQQLEHHQQLTEAWQEVDLARGRSQELAAQLEELQEEVSLQEARSHQDSSLLSELESSLDTIGLDLSKEQMTQDMASILQLLLPLAQNNLEGSKVECQLGDLQAMVQQLKGVAQCLANTCCPQNSVLQEENRELKRRLESKQDDTEVVQQAIRDRDEAIAKKNLMEVELVRSKNDMMCLNNQLLEAIQRKLELSQELEAWQDDIQIILNQQLKSQQQSEQVQRKPSTNGFSFFRRPSVATSSTWAHPPASSSPSPSPWASEVGQDKPQSLWKDWLRRGKVAQHSK